jgi:hypothetical protein
MAPILGGRFFWHPPMFDNLEVVVLVTLLEHKR